MDAVKEILRLHGYSSAEEMESGTSITVEVSGFMDLDIEKIGSNRVSVAHYYKQMGDLMSDPEIVFKITGYGEWQPVRYTQHPFREEHNENGLTRVEKSVRQWSRNLETQGYVKAAQRGVQQ